MSYSVMTFNMRCESASDGINYFYNRAPYIYQKITAEKPDIICFQETTQNMLKWLQTNLTDYTTVGMGRGPKLNSEANPVSFRKDKFDLFGLDQFWLSPTPTVPGSRYEIQSNCPRICMTVTLSPKGSGKLFRVYNTHLDHRSDSARVLGMQSVLDKIKKDNDLTELPFILTGDMNAYPDSEPIKLADNFEAYPMVETTKDLPNTFHSFGKHFDPPCHIDYIYTNKGRSFTPPVLWDDRFELEGGTIYLSDHFPILTEIDFDC